VQRAYDALKDQGVVVLAISIDGTGEKAVKPYMVKNGFTFPALIDQRMEVARQFGARATPSTFVVDRQGKIVARGVGPFELDTSDISSAIPWLGGEELTPLSHIGVPTPPDPCDQAPDTAGGSEGPQQHRIRGARERPTNRSPGDRSLCLLRTFARRHRRLSLLHVRS
jgi:hypothetical protein